MGISVDLYSYSFEKLKKGFASLAKSTDDSEKIEPIMLEFGNKIGDRYILLNNELYEDGNCYYGLSEAIDVTLGTEKSFDFLMSDGGTDREQLIDYNDEWEREE